MEILKLAQKAEEIIERDAYLLEDCHYYLRESIIDIFKDRIKDIIFN